MAKTTNKTEKPTASAAAPAKAAPAAPNAAPPEAERRLQLDTSMMKSSYCNVCNATSTREEVVLNFGLNQSWDRPGEDMHIQILHRIILSPHAANKLLDVLGSLMEEYQKRHGPLERNA